MTAVANLDTLTVGEIVRAVGHAGAWLRACGIEPLGNESLRLADACAAAAVTPGDVLEGLSALTSEHVADARVDLDRLCRFIVLHHHAYVRDALPELQAAVANLQPAGAETAARIAQLFAPVPGELTAHLAKEENILFPAIIVLAEARRAGCRPAPGAFATLFHPIRLMEAEHARVEDAFAELRLATGGFTPPGAAPGSIVTCFRALRAFDGDLRRHIRLEDELLFPQALELERAVP
jgi:regulator of cell morphogenesis and NO signaling